VPTRATRPYQGHEDADPKGMCWPGWTRTSVANSRFKGGRPLPTDQPAIVSRRSVSIRTARFTGAGRQPCAAASLPTGASHGVQDSNPARLPRTRGVTAFPMVRTPGGIRTRKYTHLKRARLPVAARAHGAATRCRPGSPAVRRRGRSRARRQFMTGPTRHVAARRATQCGVAATLTSGLSGWGTWTRTKNLVHQRHLRCRIAPYPIDLACR
jgi:hypothetical protein